jgi:single-stranded DNA-binding protein
MNPTVNLHIVHGIATKDARTGNGTVPFANVNVVTHREFIKRGETTTTTFKAFHNISAFGNRAEELAVVKEGDLVCVVGRAESRPYTDANGVNKRAHEIIVEEVNAVIPKATINVSGTPVATPAPAPAPPAAPVAPESSNETILVTDTVPDAPSANKDNPYEGDDEELPF